MDNNFSVYEFDVVINLKAKVLVSSPDEELANYPNVFVEQIKEALGYKQTELVSSTVGLIDDNLSITEAECIMNKEENQKTEARTVNELLYLTEMYSGFQKFVWGELEKLEAVAEVEGWIDQEEDYPKHQIFIDEYRLFESIFHSKYLEFNEKWLAASLREGLHPEDKIENVYRHLIYQHIVKSAERPIPFIQRLLNNILDSNLSEDIKGIHVNAIIHVSKSYDLNISGLRY